ncbi:putative transporter [Rhodococcoides fascians]|uniref:Putative transporter n=2 Tax=Rhodococcoides fascians TaxID=1828 RepID=A0A143QJD6_RHOFA|nr:putative transporter [Rhodococcus fascians]KMJ48877.1 transporter [Rhodococcus fascians]
MKTASTSRTGVSTPVVALMAIATGLSAGGNYLNQPLLDLIATEFEVSETAAATSVTVAQISYALGLLLIVPLGDVVDRRKLSVGLMILAATGQAITGFAPGLSWLLVGTAIAGLFSVAAQVIVPFAASMAHPEQAGRIVGVVMGGLLTGILLARSISGLLSSVTGWQGVYRVAAVLMLIAAAGLWRVLPRNTVTADVTYGSALVSMIRLVRTHPRLRTRAVLGGLGFASVSTVFATMTLLLSSRFGFGAVQIGLIGLAGVGGALMASVAGRLADRGLVQWASGTCAVLLIALWPMFAVGGHYWVVFVVAFVLLDLALQGVHVSNQHIVYALEPAARARINSVYMTTYFVGASAGSAVGTLAWKHFEWAGVCAAGAVFAVAALLVWLLDLQVDARRRRENTCGTPGGSEPTMVNSH